MILKQMIESGESIITNNSFSFVVIFILLILSIRKLLDKDILAGLLKPNSVFALIIYLTFAIMALRGQIGANIVENVVIMIVSFYFGKKSGEEGGIK